MCNGFKKNPQTYCFISDNTFFLTSFSWCLSSLRSRINSDFSLFRIQFCSWTTIFTTICPDFCYFTFFFFFFFLLFRAASMACGNFQARGWIRTKAASLYHTNSNAGSKPCLWSTPQLRAMLDPLLTEQHQGPNRHLQGY